MYQVRPDILEISKALGEDTRFAIFRHIASSEKPLTVKELVAMFGMHHSAIRIHLNKLEEAGLIVSRKLHRRGVVGRPQLAFLPNPKSLSVTLPVRNYEMLADLMLGWARRAGESPEVADSPEAFAAAWGRNFTRSRGRLADGPLTFNDAIPVLMEELQFLGGAPQSVDMNGGSAAFFMTNCPFFELAERYDPLVCSLHRGVSRGILSELTGQEIEWRQEGTLAQGQDACKNRFSLNGDAG